MRLNPLSQNGFLIPRIFLGLALVSAAFFLAFVSFAANPTSGSLSPTTTAPVTWAGTAKGGQSDPSGTLSGEETCVDGQNCDVFTVTLTGNPADWAGKKARIDISWGSAANDYDIYIHKGTVTGPIVSSSAAGNTKAESADIDPSKPGVGTGVFVAHIVYWAVPRFRRRSINTAARPALLGWTRRLLPKCPGLLRPGSPECPSILRLQG